MWKALDLLQRNVTRSLPPRRDTGARGSSGGGAPGVDSSSAKITSKTSAAWVPESIMNVKKEKQYNCDQRKRKHQLLHSGNSTADADIKKNSCYVLETVELIPEYLFFLRTS